MKKTGQAVFVKRPRRLGELTEQFAVKELRFFEVAAEIVLKSIDYTNFVTDMLADRQFIEDKAELCHMGAVWKCLLVCSPGMQGVLVMPERGCFVGWAALLTE